ncbi:MAG: SH3 domain-containing protein [Anaerolineae bacterium]|nr:SH3 domain-containing protein [Anaerolineae bacterium]
MLRWWLAGIVGVLIILTAGCQGVEQTRVSAWLQPDTVTLVSFPLTAASQHYTFRADPIYTTQLTLARLTPGLPYKAELRDSRGSVLATIGGEQVENTILLLAPDDGLYEVAINDADRDDYGMLSLLVGSQLTLNAPPAANASATRAAVFSPPPQIAALTGALNPLPCSVRTVGSTNVNIRSGPQTTYPVVGSLLPGVTLAVIGRSSSDWFQINLDNGDKGWVSGGVTILEGGCEQLPTLNVPQTLLLNEASSANFSRTLTISNTRDELLLTTTALSSTYREFAITVLCSGSVERLHWGTPEQPAFACGQSITLPFTSDFAQQSIALALNADSPQDVAVNYTVLVSPL